MIMQYKLSENFINKLKEIYSYEELKIIEAGFNTIKRPVTFRVNTLKSSNNEIEQILSQAWLKFEKISYLSNWYKLINWKEKDLWDLDIFSSWKIYMQGITSQLIWEIVSTTSPLEERGIKQFDVKVLDLAAAPGGKTSHVWAILENKWEIVANELNTIRFDKLKFTVWRQWVKNIVLEKWDARDLKNKYSEWYFDIIIADLPCSAEWRINLENEKSYWFLDNPWLNKKNYKLQADILKNAISLLKDNGILIYSTCTLSPEENEWIVHFLLSNYKNLEIVDINHIFDDINIKKYVKPWIKKYKKFIYRNEVEKSIRILPSLETEWFFVWVFKKSN